LAAAPASLAMKLHVAQLELARDTQKKTLPKEAYDLFEAALCDNADRFKAVLERPEVHAFLVDPSIGIENYVLDNGDTLVHTMAERSAACLRIFLEFCKHNAELKEKQVNAIYLNMPDETWSLIHDYVGRVNYICIAALGQPNYLAEIPFTKAVNGVHIASVELFLDFPVVPTIYLLQRALAQLNEYRSLIAKTSNFLKGTGWLSTRVRMGFEKNPDCDDPLLKLRHIISAALSTSWSKTVVGNTPLIVDYFLR
jgi:hypothetical protein